MVHAALFLCPKLRCIDVTDLCMIAVESVFMWKIIVLYCRVIKQIFIYVVSSPIIYEKFMWKIVIHGSEILFCRWYIICMMINNLYTFSEYNQGLYSPSSWTSYCIILLKSGVKFIRAFKTQRDIVRFGSKTFMVGYSEYRPRVGNSVWRNYICLTSKVNLLVICILKVWFTASNS